MLFNKSFNMNIHFTGQYHRYRQRYSRRAVASWSKHSRIIPDKKSFRAIAKWISFYWHCWCRHWGLGQDTACCGIPRALWCAGEQCRCCNLWSIPYLHCCWFWQVSICVYASLETLVYWLSICAPDPVMSTSIKEL